MIPILYRMDAVAEKEYIERAIKCIGFTNAEDYSYRLNLFLEEMSGAGYSVADRILVRAQRFRNDYQNKWVLCEWLVMPYNELAKVKEYLCSIIRSDLEPINAEIKKIGSRIVKIKNYHDLQRRRKCNYEAHPNIGKMIKGAVKYDNIYNQFQKFITIYSRWPQSGINYWIIEKTELKVCPYCNISYTYSRGKAVTAQLDHFFPKVEYPVLALCFYNLVPSCPACNKLKLDDTEEMVSPYKDGAFQNLRFIWKYDGKDEDDEMDSLAILEDRIEIEIETFRADERRNLTRMKIEEAYQKHKDYASEVIKKARIYTNPLAQKLICDICGSEVVTPAEVERFYFGNYLNENDLKTRPLSKMVRDFYQEIVRAKNKP